jgi:hypothetical protein
MSAGRIILLIFGILFVLVSLGLIAGGGVILAFEGSFKDSEGFYTIHDIPVRIDSLALVTSPADFHFEPGWWWGHRNPLTVKVEATNAIEGKSIFIGIARTIDLDRYLGNVNYDEVTGFSVSPSHLDLSRHTGSALPAPPSSQNFWVASASGSGTQTLRWEVATGSYALVLMNADITSPIYAEVSLGARIPQVLHGIGLGLLIGGIVVLVIGGVMIFFAARGW